ncbi:MAG: redoxin domain-containing protein [Thermoanaerobaculia bacterium]
MRRIVLWMLLCSAVASQAVTFDAPPAPNLRMQTLAGTSLSLESLKGKVVILDFWAPWCIPCRKSFPFLDSLQKRHAAQGLAVVGLTLDENRDAIDAFVEAIPVTFTVALDPSGRAGESFHVVAMPTTFLLDREGRIVARFEGSDTSVHEKLEASVATLLGGGTLGSGADVRISKGLQATGSVKAWQRGYLADPIMNLDGDPITRILREHIHASKEAAAGDGGASGGGCGCN